MGAPAFGKLLPNRTEKATFSMVPGGPGGPGRPRGPLGPDKNVAIYQENRLTGQSKAIKSNVRG